jgi:3-oxoacyl-[acyl-carrier protein] reductase
MKRLENKVAIVTGGCRGIGREISIVLAAEGASVTVGDIRDDAEPDGVITAIQKNGGIAQFVRVDVTRPVEVENMVDATLQSFGKVDVLVNNAGINRDALLPEMSYEDWRAVLDTNLGGVFNCTKAVIKPMILQGKGKIINISSIAAELGWRGQSNYAASKAAINGFTKSAAAELAPFGILVNAVAPGLIATEMTRKLRGPLGNRLLPSISLGRFGEPADVARVVLFLASDDADYLSGEIIHVTGGLGASIALK